MSKKKKAKKAAMEQGVLTLVAPPFVNRDTSIEAAEAIKPQAPILREAVYQAIESYGPITDERIAYLLNMNPSTQRPRRLELQQQGRIIPAGQGKTSSGRKAQMWAVA